MREIDVAKPIGQHASIDRPGLTLLDSGDCQATCVHSRDCAGPLQQLLPSCGSCSGGGSSSAGQQQQRGQQAHQGLLLLVPHVRHGWDYLSTNNSGRSSFNQRTGGIA